MRVVERRTFCLHISLRDGTYDMYEHNDGIIEWEGRGRGWGCLVLPTEVKNRKKNRKCSVTQ